MKKAVITIALVAVAFFLAVRLVLTQLQALFDSIYTADITTVSRPDWPGQITTEDVKPGVFLYEVGRNFKYEILVLSTTYTKDGMCQFDSVIWSDSAQGIGFPDNNFCADFGLTPYGTGKWNKYDYITRSNRPAVSPDQLEIIKKMLLQPRLPPEQLLPDPRIRIL